MFHIDPIPGTRRPSCSAMKLHSSENESETNYSAVQQFSDFCPKNRPRRSSYANEGISYANESAIRRFPDQGDRLKDPTLQPSPTGQPLATGAIKCNLFFATKQPPNNPLRNPLRQRKNCFSIFFNFNHSMVTFNPNTSKNTTNNNVRSLKVDDWSNAHHVTLSC